MKNELMQSCILESLPYPLIFVDTDHMIRYMNAAAIHKYCTVRGYKDLIGKSLLDCHNESSSEIILEEFEKAKSKKAVTFLDGSEEGEFQYMHPVYDQSGELIGYIEHLPLKTKK